MGQKTKIDWADSTWNPVTGCLHECPYCYARNMARRFEGCDAGSTFGVYSAASHFHRVNPYSDLEHAMFEVSEDRPPVNVTFNPKTQKQRVTVAPYPFGFHPTLRRDRFDQPRKWKEPRNIFVCSMADLFGDWIPAEWICEVFNEARKAPQHRYLFLTKNPERYGRLLTAGLLPNDDNFWYGATWETDAWNTSGGNRCYEVSKEAYNVQTEDYAHRPVKPNAFHWQKVPGAAFFPDIGDRHRFISFEPLLMDVFRMRHVNIRKQWFIIGAETGNRKGKIKPEREWIEHILRDADESRVPVFMKESVRDIMGDDFRQEFPWEVK